VLPATGQQYDLDFEHFSLGEGLVSDVVMALERDATGRLWIGTQLGLTRYDGAQMRTFNRLAQSTGSLTDDYIRALEEDASNPGAMWVGTSSGGVSRFDPMTERFSTFTTRNSELASDEIRDLQSSADGTLWIGTSNAGLSRYTRASGRFESVRHDPDDPNSLISDQTRVLYVSPSAPGMLWVGTLEGLSILDVQSRRFSNFRHAPGDTTTLSHSAVTAIAEAGGAIWCGTQDGVLHRFNPESQTFTRFDRLLSGAPLGEISVLAASPSDEDRLWIGTRGQGLFAFDTRSLTARRITHPRDESQAQSGVDVFSLKEDRDQILWVGTFTGLDKALLQDRFSASIETPLPDEIADLPVLTVFESRNAPGVAWLGTLHEGLVRFDRRTGNYERYFHDAPGHPLSRIFAINQDQSGRLWLGSNEGLYRFDMKTGSLQRFWPSGDHDLQIRQLYKAPSQSGVLWAATRNRGLFRVNIRDPVTIDPFPGELASDYIWSVYEPSHEPGYLWVAMHSGGLGRVHVRQYDSRSTTAHATRIFDRSNSCLSTNRIVSIASRESGVLWLGTFDSGLIRFDTRSETCTHYTPEDGLAHVDVATITIDGENRLWMTTSNGLSLFDPERSVFTTFTKTDGLRNTSFFYHAQHQNDTGEIYVGGRNGFDVFHPDSVTINTDPPPLAITELTISGQRYPPKEYQGRSEPIILGYDENDISVRFAALDLRNPARNQYKIRLHESDAWTPLGHEVSARFFSLSPGAYDLRIIGANSDGYWNADGVGLAFQIKPPFWRAWWFWALLGAFAASIVAAGYQYRLHQLLRVERTRQRIADDLHDDIGSKISNVALKLDMAGRSPALNEPARHQLTSLSATAQGVVDDLRDTVWLVDAEHDRLPDLAMRMEQFAGQILANFNYEFRRASEIPPLTIGMDMRRHLYLFYKEALHNAVRHGEPGTVSITLSYDSDHFVLRVSDDGIGFDPETVKRGRGLHTMKKRAAAVEGEFAIDTAQGRGTTIRLEVEIT
jgi:signal transduction histidine kinase/ligand-binding sensor domain-containing protein